MKLLNYMSYEPGITVVVKLSYQVIIALICHDIPITNMLGGSVNPSVFLSSQYSAFFRVASD